MNNEMIVSRVKSSLPSLMTACTYCEFDNMFHTPSYVTDRASYYQGARLSDKIAVVFNLADGYYHRFLNGVKIYGSDGNGKTKLLVEKIYPMYEGLYWSESTGMQEAKNLLSNYILNQFYVMGQRLSYDQASYAASLLVGETVSMTKALAGLVESPSGGSSPRRIGWQPDTRRALF